MTQTPSHAHLPRRKTRMLVLCTGHGRGLRGCHGPRISHHAVAALDGITGARVDWADSKDLGTLARHAATWDMRVRYPSSLRGS